MIKTFGEKTGFPPEAIGFLEEQFCILQQKEMMNSLYAAMDNFFCETDEKYLDVLREIAEKTGIHRMTVDMIFLILCTKPLFYLYRQKGLGEELFWDTMCDLKYKLMECKAVYNVWGTFVTRWFRRFYLCERFKLGRLQYETVAFGCAAYRDVLKEGDTVYNCHIPSSGALTPDAVMDSLRRAHEFYKPEGGVLPVVCYSWLLYPPYQDVFPADSNMAAFAQMFDVIESKSSPNQEDFWRIFHCKPTNDLQKLPHDTTLQRNFIAYLQRGNDMGTGLGVLLFDGKHILNR
ncbi:MAG: DUF5596 domain-containing protein [Clostridia bacterium]|nr:DUF5596 domain-containing protein [Clostridia bacterium]